MRLEHHRSRWLVAGLVAAALAVSGSLSGPTATASASSWNDRWQFLRFPATLDQAGCEGRSIYLAAGTYRWRLFSAHWAHTDQTRWRFRRIHLRRGHYTWIACITKDLRIFRSHSALWERGRPGNPAWLTGGKILGAFGNGTYHWGSALDRL